MTVSLRAGLLLQSLAGALRPTCPLSEYTAEGTTGVCISCMISNLTEGNHCDSVGLETVSEIYSSDYFNNIPVH